MTLNDTLALVNGNLALLRIEFGIFLFLYIARQVACRELGLSDWLLSLPLGVAVAVSLFVNTTGEWGRNIIVWVWRAFYGGARPFTDFELGALFAFALVAVVGLLMMIRVFSKPLFGDWPWIACAASAVLYTAITVGWFT